MKIKFYIFIFLMLGAMMNLFAQDKLVLKSGKKINCKILSINLTTVDYKDSTISQNAFTIQKGEVLMAELKNGEVYIFGNETSTAAMSAKQRLKADKNSERKAAVREKEKNFKDNIFGFQPIDIVWGRLTFTGERLFMEKRMGITIPFSLTFDPRVLTMGGNADTIVSSNPRNDIRRTTGVITGLDLNYYYETRGYSKFFFGPRFRYGTDVSLYNITGYSIQFQNGFLLCSANGKFASTFAIGVGFARVIASPIGNAFNTKQGYPWASFTLRLGFRR